MSQPPHDNARDLGLVGDGDETDLIGALERAFGIRFGPSIETCRTVGDLFAALLATFQASEQGGRCGSAMAFYRLRRALTTHGLPGILPADRLVPATPLADILERTGMSAAALRDNLEHETTLALPPLALARIGTIGAMLVLIGLFGFFLSPVFGIGWLVPIGFGLAGAGMLWLDPREFAQDTLGDLAREVAARNAARLIAEGADGHENALWKAFVEVIRGETGPVRGEIVPGTLLLDRAGRSPVGTA